MICPKCQYVMDSFDEICPRCHGKDNKSPDLPNVSSNQSTAAPLQPFPSSAVSAQPKINGAVGNSVPPPPSLPTTTTLRGNTQFCHKCGSKNPKFAQHCNQCGAILGMTEPTDWGKIIGYGLGVLLIVVVLLGFRYAGNLVKSDGTLTNPIAIRPKIDKSDLQEQIKTELNNKLATKQADLPPDKKYNCTDVALVLDSDTKERTKYTGFVTYSDGTKSDLEINIDNQDGTMIWKTGPFVN